MKTAQEIIIDLRRVLRGIEQGSDEQWKFIANVCANADDWLAAAPSALEQWDSSVIADAPQAAPCRDSGVIEKQEGLTDEQIDAMWAEALSVEPLPRPAYRHFARALLASQPAAPVGEIIGYHKNEQLGTVYSHAKWDGSWLPSYAAPVGGASFCNGEAAGKAAQKYLDEQNAEGIAQLNSDWGDAAPVEAVAPAPGESVHRDDIAVDAFTIAMKNKMASSRAKGRGGWNDESQCTIVSLAKMLVDHVTKGDPVDIANFAMMLHQRECMLIEHHPCHYGAAAKAIKAAQGQDGAVAPLLDAVGKLVKARGRFHTEQNYVALVAAYDDALLAQLGKA